MPAQASSAKKGGKCMTTSETRKMRYAHYGQKHQLALKGNKLGPASKEKRGCGPLARYNRRKAVMNEYYAGYKEMLAANQRAKTLQLPEVPVLPLPFDPASIRQMREHDKVLEIQRTHKFVHTSR